MNHYPLPSCCSSLPAKRTEMEANTLLLDGNYTNGPLLKSTSEFDIDVLSPLKKNSQKTKIPKDDFEYDAARDTSVHKEIY